MKKRKRIIYAICAVILLIAAWNLWKIRQSTEKSTTLYQALADQAHAEEEKTTAAEESEKEEDAQSSAEAAEELPGPAAEAVEEQPDDVRAGYDPIVNPWIVDLQKQNQDLAGWLRIPGTNIDYPVMQTVEDNDFYLNHDFEGQEDPHGTPFLDVNCRIGQSENLIIYGHHMKDGTMFQNLMLYKNAEFCEKNGVIQFDTPIESAQYQLLYVLVISEKEAMDFPYYQYIDLPEEKNYEEFRNQCARYAIWSAEEISQTCGELLTLSTCEYSKENGRLVVVAAKTEREEGSFASTEAKN